MVVVVVVEVKFEVMVDVGKTSEIYKTLLQVFEDLQPSIQEIIPLQPRYSTIVVHGLHDSNHATF